MPFLSTYTYLPHSYLPTYLPNYTEWSTRSDKRFTYRTARWIYRSAVCDVDILKSRPSGVALSRAEPSWAAPRLLVDFAPFCSYFRKSEEQLAHTNSGIAMRCIFSFSYSRSSLLVYGNSCSLHSARNTRANCPFVDKFIIVFSSLRIIRSSHKNVAKIDFWIYVFRYIISIN